MIGEKLTCQRVIWKIPNWVTAKESRCWTVWCMVRKWWHLRLVGLGTWNGLFRKVFISLYFNWIGNLHTVEETHIPWKFFWEVSDCVYVCFIFLSVEMSAVFQMKRCNNFAEYSLHFQYYYSLWIFTLLTLGFLHCSIILGWQQSWFNLFIVFLLFAPFYVFSCRQEVELCRKIRIE